MTRAITTKNIKQVTTDQLKLELGKALTMTAKTLKYLAMIWRELEERGEDLPDLRTGLAGYLPKIADGELDADLVVKYAGQRMLLNAISGLPLDEQKILANNGYVTKVSLDDEGRKIEVQTPLHRLASTDIRLVFSEDQVRSTDEQFLMLSNKPKPKKSRPRKARKITIDRDNNLLIAGRTSLSIDKVVDALSEYYGRDISKVLEK